MKLLFLFGAFIYAPHAAGVFQPFFKSYSCSGSANMARPNARMHSTSAVPRLLPNFRKKSLAVNSHRNVVESYWKGRTSDEVAEELERLGFEGKEDASEEDLLDELVERVTKLAMKYSSTLFNEKGSSPAVLRWEDFFREPDAERGERVKRDPLSPQRSHLHPRVIGNSMSAEELNRRVMGGASDLDSLLDNRGDDGFSAKGRFSHSSSPDAGGKIGRFGRYKDAALPSEVRIDQESWLNPFAHLRSASTASMASLAEEAERKSLEKQWREKPGFLAQGRLIGCEHGNEKYYEGPCVLQMMIEGEYKTRNFILDTTKGDKISGASDDKKKRIEGRSFPSFPTSTKPILEGGITVDGILDASFLSQYDLDIDFGRQVATIFEAGSLLRHNPSVPGGRQIDLPITSSDKESGRVTVKARIRTEMDIDDEGHFVPGDSQDVVAVVSTRHIKSLIAPWTASKFSDALEDQPCDDRAQGAIGVAGGGVSGSRPLNCKGVVAVVEFADSANHMIQTDEEDFDIMDTTENELEEFLTGHTSSSAPDVILGLDVLAGPSSSNRVSISWAQERIRISTPRSAKN